MAKVKSSIAAAARDKARSAKAALDAQREEQDRLVEAATTDFYIAVEEAEVARTEVLAAEERQGEALRRLVALGEDNETISALTGAAMTVVRSARKSAAADKNATDTVEQPEDDPGTPAQE